MGNALAVAAVTATLRKLLRDGLVEHDVGTAVGEVGVSVLPPDQVEAKLDPGKSQLNLFLFRVCPNPGWRNVGLPSRNADGDAVAHPPLALDLHYLLSVHSDQDLHAELLLGYAMQVLHEGPVLDRAALGTAFDPPPPSGPADPAEQVELIKLTLEPLGLEELSHLWSNLQAHYRASAAYQASVVLIESSRPARPATPVRAVASLVTPLRRPVIESLASLGPGDTEPDADRPILAGDRLVLRGARLTADDVRLQLDDRELHPPVRDDAITVPLPADLPAGAHGVQVVHRFLLGDPPVPHAGTTSNVVGFLLRPTVAVAGPATPTGDAVRVRLRFTPPVGRAQRLTVVLEQSPSPAPPGRPFVTAVTVPRRPTPDPDDPGPDDELVVDVGAVPQGRYRVRVQVDGAESPMLFDQRDPTVVVA